LLNLRGDQLLEIGGDFFFLHGHPLAIFEEKMRLSEKLKQTLQELEQAKIALDNLDCLTLN